jgi:hypothetical protein
MGKIENGRCFNCNGVSNIIGLFDRPAINCLKIKNLIINLFFCQPVLSKFSCLFF